MEQKANNVVERLNLYRNTCIIYWKIRCLILEQKEIVFGTKPIIIVTKTFSFGTFDILLEHVNASVSELQIEINDQLI